MKYSSFITLASLAALSGCAHNAQHYIAPNSAPLQTTSRKLAAAVVASTQAVKVASDAVGAAEKSHASEAQTLEVLSPRVDTLLRAAPPELRPLVQEVQTEVGELRMEQAATTQDLTQAKAAQELATEKLAEANTAKDEVAKLSPAYFAEVDQLTDRANAAEAGWAADSKQLTWYKEHWWGAWIVAGVGLLVCAAVAILKFTGRLALSGAAIAAKV